MPADTPVIVDSARIVVEGGVARAEGPVRVVAGDGTIVADGALVTLDTGRAELGPGTWTRPGETLSFAAATVDLRDGTGRLAAARFDGGGGMVAAGAAIGRAADGSIVADDVVVTLCDCPGPEPWSVSARHVELVPNEVLRFRGGWIRVLDVPVVPVPAGSVPLARRSGFLPPTGGFGDDGVRVSTPLYLVLGRSADVTLAPELRTERSARLLAEHRYATAAGGGTTNLAAGYDWARPGVRGGIDWAHRDGGPVGFATVGRLASEGVSRDYGDVFLARQQPWHEARALVWSGPLEGSVDVVQSDEPAWQDARVALRPGAVRLGGWLYDGFAEAGVRTVVPDEGRELVGVVRDGARFSHTATAGPVVFTSSLRGAAEVRSSLGPRSRPTGEVALDTALDVRLPAWRVAGSAVDRLEPGVVTAVEVLTARPTVAPSLRWSRAGAGGAGGGELAWSPLDRNRVVFDGWIGTGGVTAWSHVAYGADDRALAPSWAGLSAVHGPVSLGGSWVYADEAALRETTAATDLHQLRGDAGWTLPGALSPFRVGVGAAWDAAGGAFLSRHGSLSWTHPTGCLTLGATARFDADRGLPDVAFVVDPLPRR